MIQARRLAVGLVLILLLVGCTAPSSVAPGTGPASTTHSPQRKPKPTASAGRPVTGSFHQQIVYPDGVAVEVVRIKHTRLSDIGWTDTGLHRIDQMTEQFLKVLNPQPGCSA